MSWILDKEIKRALPEEWKSIVPTEVFIREAEIRAKVGTKKRWYDTVEA